MTTQGEAPYVVDTSVEQAALDLARGKGSKRNLLIEMNKRAEGLFQAQIMKVRGAQQAQRVHITRS